MFSLAFMFLDVFSECFVYDYVEFSDGAYVSFLYDFPDSFVDIIF